jgi:Uma2 family endonuclease
MEWAEVLKNPLLQNLPFKIELNKFGKLLMSPASNRHGILQSKVIIGISKNRTDGEIITECSINTSDGVKVADVAWASDEFISEFGYKTPYEKAPELCVEVVSPSNSPEELHEKIDLYLAKGAVEVWTVSEDGIMNVHNNTGEAKRSALVKRFKL